MGYCRFRNTLSDLRDCYYHMGDDKELSLDEEVALKHLIALCRTIVEEYAEDYED